MQPVLQPKRCIRLRHSDFSGESTNTSSTAINDNGQVTGYAYIPNQNGGSDAHAFLYASGVLADPGTGGARESQGFGINNSGEIAGTMILPNRLAHAFEYTDGAMIDRGALPNGSLSEAHAINNSGQITGSASIGRNGQSFIHTNGAMIGIGSLVGPLWNVGNAVNDAGEIAGFFNVPTGYHAFIYSNGVTTDIGTLGGAAKTAHAINDSGQVAGDSAPSRRSVCIPL